MENNKQKNNQEECPPMTDKVVIGDYIIRWYYSNEDPNWKPVTRDEKYYKEFREKTLQEGVAKLKKKFKKLREEYK